MTEEVEPRKEKLLKNQVAIITGSGYGIGQGIAVEFAREGANIVVNDLDPKRANKTKKLLDKLDVNSLCVNGDIATPTVQEDLVLQTIEKFGGIDILVNNVGIGSGDKKGPTKFTQSTASEWEKIWKTNFLAGALLARDVANHMIETNRKGKIIFITSVHQECIAREPMYSTTKAGLKMLVEELGVELAPYGIRVNSVAPGFIGTRPEATLKRQPGSHLGKTPLGRAGLPEEIGRVAVFLASDYWSSYITAATIFVDGGLHTFNWRTLEFPPDRPKT